MPIEFRKDHGHAERVRMLKVMIPKVGVTITALFGTDTDLWRTLRMHHDVELNRQVPCLGDLCRYCPKPTREVTYVSALVVSGAPAAGMFHPRIIPVTDGWHEVLAAPLSSKLIAISRPYRHASCVWRIGSDIGTYGLSPFKGVDVEPSLRRMWGVKD